MPLLTSNFFLLILSKPKTLTLIRHYSTSQKPISNGGGVLLYLRRARLIDSLRRRLLLHDPSKPFTFPPTPDLDSFVAAQVVRAASSTDLAISFFNSLPFSHPSISHSLLKRVSLSRRVSDLRSLLDSVDLRLSPIDRLRLLSSAGDLDGSVKAWSEIKSSAAAANRHACTEAYNLIINLYASQKSDSAAVGTFFDMIADGAIPNSRTYTVIIDHLIRSGNLDAAMEVFEMLPLMRVKRTSKQYNVIAEGFSSSNRFEDLKSLVNEMRSDGILAGRSMRDSLSKLKLAGHGEFVEDVDEELHPNEEIGGCGIDEDEDEDEGEVEDEEGGDITEDERTRLKRWMDPIALTKALNGWDPLEVRALESAGFVWTPRLVCKMLRSFKKTEPAWEFFCWVAYQPGRFTHDRRTVSRMIAILARAGHAELVDRLVSKLKSEDIRLPFATVRLAIDFYGLAKKSEPAIKLYRDAGSICGPLTESHRVLLCSSLLRTMVKCRREHETLEMLEGMMAGGILPDLQTFSGLMQFFAEGGDLKGVHKLFGLVRECGLEPDGYTYRVLVRAYCKSQRAALGYRVFEEMRGLGLVLDRGTKGLLVRSLWKEGKLREAATVEERCEGLEGRMPAALPGHVWTVSEKDFRRVCEICSSCFKEERRESAGD